MNNKKLGLAAIGLACMTLAGCVSEGSNYGGYSSYNRVYDRSDRSDYWVRRQRDRHYRDGHHGRPHNGRPDHGRPNHHDGRPDRPDREHSITRGGSGSWGRDRHDSGRTILIPNR